MRKYWILIAVVVVFACQSLLADWHSIDLTVSVDPQKIMSADERREFGVDKFTAKQRQDFKVWLSHYALGIANQFQSELNKQVNALIKSAEDK